MKFRFCGFGLIVVLNLLPFCFANAQVTGQVLDADQHPIFGAHVLASPSERIARTDETGFFRFNQLSQQDTLIVSHVAFFSDTLLVRDSKEKVTFVLKEKVVSFENIVVTPGYDPSFQMIQAALQTKVLNSSQELLKLVPGLFIGQHAGGGKAEQLFLRGFDLDHGTDIAIHVDGMPVNMVSHAHGQGYADLHFLIPETVQHLHFEKGPYDPDQGNFNVAGNVSFQTKTRMESQVQAEWGQFGTRRLFGAINLLNNKRHQSYVAAETYFTEGPFDSPQGLRKYNLLLKEQWRLGSNQWLGFKMMGFSNSWTASGQIPNRLVRDGRISRFGAVDDTEGGSTSRMSFSSDFKSTLSKGSFYSQLDWIRYDFELYSNFTFFLNDPINGDQIRQAESRTIWQGLTRYESDFSLFGNLIAWNVGLGNRSDRVAESELTHTQNRTENLERRQFGSIEEDNMHGLAGIETQFGTWHLMAGIRYDFLKFSYQDQLSGTISTATQGFLSPKLTIGSSLSDDLQIKLKLARGFHSNDARVVTQSDSLKTLPAAYGTDLEFNWQPMKNVYFNFIGYHLFLQQELVYVGDEGIVEPSGRSIRKGLELGVKVKPYAGLFLQADINFAHSRFKDLEADNNFVPLAPKWSGTFALDYHHRSGLQFGVTYSGMSDRPANEDHSITALGYGITSTKCRYETKGIGVSIEIQNLFNVDWNEAQFATNSRLQDEPDPVEELHYTPGSPFFIKSALSYRF